MYSSTAPRSPLVNRASMNEVTVFLFWLIVSMPAVCGRVLTEGTPTTWGAGNDRAVSTPMASSFLNAGTAGGWSARPERVVGVARPADRPARSRGPAARRHAGAAPRMRDDLRGRRASCLRHAVSRDVRWRTKGCLMEITNLGKADGLPPVDWAAVAEKLHAGSAPAPDAANSRTTWLSTINEDGSPHVTAVGALWLDGTFWFQTGAGTRKGRNVARDPRCSIAVSIRDADVVIEGDAVRVTEPGAVARIAKAWADNGWPAEPDESGSGSLPRSTRRRKDHRRGTCAASSRARRPWSWRRTRAA